MTISRPERIAITALTWIVIFMIGYALSRVL